MKKNCRLFSTNTSLSFNALSVSSVVYSVILSSLLSFSNSVSAAEQSIAVGKTTLIIGKSFLIRSGNKTEIKRGHPIYVGDKVTTLNNGHVHIKFKDQGIVSVRPNSKLHIKNYQFDVKTPADSAVKFELERGVVRSVSGKAAKAARDKFRMNTPIAAIGVRGTDFVVSANNNKMQAFVNEGAIVVSPFSDLCSAASTGPCSNNSVELRGNSGQLLELNNQQSLATIRAASGEVLPALLYQSQNKILRKKKKRSISKEVLADESTTVDNVNTPVEDVTNEITQVSTDGDQVNLNSLLLTSSETGEESNSDLIKDTLSFDTDTDTVELVPTVAVDPVAPTTIVIDPTLTAGFTNLSPIRFVTPATSLSEEDLNTRQLVWGRWSEADSLNDKISVSYKIATADRRISVGTSSLGLFRKDNETLQLANNLGKISFDLQLADIDFVTASSIEQMDVNAASLNMDFNTNNFSTNLSLQSNSTGALGFSAQGKITDTGFFTSSNTQQKLSGAVSYDGSEAGYFFEKQLESGSLQGSTLWGRE